MIVDGNKVQGSGAPPHELDVRKFAESRASELDSLHSIISNRLNNDFRSQRNKRKRTTGHDDRVAKRKRSRMRRRRRRDGIGDAQRSESLKKDDKKISRRVRRSIELKRNPQKGFITSGDGTKRLRTHVWHAKRFTMTKLWGFHLPLALHGRGRGSRALLKKLRNGVLLHDASYNEAIQLEGPQDLLVAVLSSVLGPIPSEQISHVLSGDIFRSAMLYHAEKQYSQPICPAIYMGRPLQLITNNAEEGSSSAFHEKQCMDDGMNIRQIWMWIHAAAFREAFEALTSACKRHMELRGITVQCTTLEGRLAKLELIGPETLQLLQKTLLPVSRISEESCIMEKCSIAEVDNQVGENMASILNDNCKISPGAIVPFIVKDPRALSMTDHQEKKGQVGCRDLWDASKGLFPPMEEHDICMDKNRQRREITQIARTTHRTQTVSIDREYSKWCPILLLKNKDCKDTVIWYSVVLPLSWAKVFWMTFVSNGAHVIGLKEKKWIAAEIGIPCFPRDFPDCNAYANFIATDAVVSDQKARLRPPAMTPLKVPILPPWNSVQHRFEKESCEAGDSSRQVNGFGSDTNGIAVIDNNMVKTALSQKSDVTKFGCLGVPFEGFVERTSSMLGDFLNVGDSSQLHVFPRVLGLKNLFAKYMKDRESLEPHLVASEFKQANARCFLRVLLHAFKEGAFEDGAVVCAPRVADIILWTRTGSESEELQIPDSLLKSYFVQLPSGKWELQIPEDHVAQESFRWPIGFVTTGFVRGSRKAMAGALCEASLLSRIRMEQWKELPVRQRRNEIFVLVRNLRSTAYRLSLATIVLEQQEDDIYFM